MRKSKFAVLMFVLLGVIVLMSQPAMGKQLEVFGKPLNVHGYLTQQVSFSLADDDKYDTEENFQSALMNGFLEGDYEIHPDLRLYGAGMLTVDWMYDFKDKDSTWNKRLFSDSRDELYKDDEYWQILKEVHFTYSPGNFMFRVGKQIVAWGETDGFRLVDQINPMDQRRGFADVEFETTIIPIWLVRADYYVPEGIGPVQDLAFQFIFNPNADFIPNQLPTTGNDAGGIWAPNIAGPPSYDTRVLGIPGMDFVPAPMVPFLPPFFQPIVTSMPLLPTRVGSMDFLMDEPDNWSEGHEFAFRISSVVYDAIVTLNGFYGRDNDPVLVPAPLPPTFTIASDGVPLLHQTMIGKYPRFRYIGATFSRDFPSVKSSFLGGVSPLLKLEAMYAFDSTFATQMGQLVKSDELRWSIGIDWKIKIPALNPYNYFMINGQFYHRKIRDYPTAPIGGVEDDNYMATLLLKTFYLNAKLSPHIWWTRDITNKADFVMLQLTYDYSSTWEYTLGALIMGGDEEGKGFEPFDNKDQVFFKITYRF